MQATNCLLIHLRGLSMSIEKPGASTNEFPNWWRSGLNYLAAVGRYAAAGAPNVSASIYSDRMNICAQCPLCRGGKCLICGCSVAAKAQMATERCPHDP